MSGILNFIGSRARHLLRREREQLRLTPSDVLRIRLWQSRARRSRSTGVAFLFISGAFLALSFVAGYSPFEAVAIVAFVMGAFLISTELESTVKVTPSAESLLGPLYALSGVLEAKGMGGSAFYVPGESGTVMEFRSEGGDSKERLVPVGRGLSVAFEREIGPLKDVGLPYVQTWVPKAITKGVGLAAKAKVKAEGNSASAAFERPYVRSLCVRPDFRERVCSKTGCPLVSSVAEVLAVSTGKEVHYLGCGYEALKETSLATYEIEV